MHRRQLAGLAWITVSVALSTREAAAAHVRPRFEPTDLELEDPGTVELDTQFGPSTGDSGDGRVFVPDYEIDLGLTERVELDFDGVLALEPLRTRTHLVIGEPSWLSTKIGLLDVKDVGPAQAAALGVQLGPRLSLGSDLHGVGYQALALAGLAAGPAQFVFNVGGGVDPAASGTNRRPYGAVGGVDITMDLDRHKRWQFLGEIGVSYYFAEYPKQLTTTAGFSRTIGCVDVSLIALASTGNADRWGTLLGISPKFSLF